MALDTYNKEQKRLEKEDAIEEGIPQVPEDTLTLKQIFANNESSELFGKMLELEGGYEDLIVRLFEGKILDSDIPLLEEKRAKFSEKMRAAEDIQKELSAELVVEMGALDPGFEKITKLVSSDKAASFIKSQMKQIAVTDPSTFDQIVDSIEALQSFKNGEFRDLDKRIIEESKLNGFDPDQYMKLLAIADSDERHEALNEMVKSKWDKNGFGLLKRSLNIGGYFSHAEVSNNLEGQKAEIDAAYASLNQYKKLVGEILAASISNNPDLLNALSREIVGVPKKKEIVGMEDVKKEMQIPDDANIQKAWGDNLNKNFKDWSSLGDIEKDSARKTFAKNLKNNIQGKIVAKGGFWSGIFSSIFDTMFNIDISKLN